MPNQPRAGSGESQISKFKEVARELGCDPSEKAFNAALGKIAQHKPAIEHWSDCTVNNGPALKAGPCDCGGIKSDS
jgi:hypothetical protein